MSGLVHPRGLASEQRLRDAVGGRVVLLTGASYGLGAATARRLGAAGATVLLVARTKERLDEVAAEIVAAGGRPHVYPVDLCDSDAVAALAEAVLAEHGGVDVLVSNAAKSIRRSLDLQYDRYHDFTRTIGTNYLGPVRLLLALLPSMRARGGHIVNVSSMAVRIIPGPRWGAYQASKGAFDTWLRSVAPEVDGDGVDVTTIYMPVIRTRMSEPTPSMRRLPGLSAEAAAGIVARALADRPARISPWWLGPMELGSVVGRRPLEWGFSRFVGFTRDSPSAAGLDETAPSRRAFARGAGRVVRSGVVSPPGPGRAVRAAGAIRQWGATPAAAVAVAAARWPTRPALIDEAGTLTWVELDQRTDALAAGLGRSFGAGPDLAVALIARNHRGFVETTLATAKLGADLLAVGTELPAAQLGAVLARHRVAVLVHDEEFAPVVTASGFAGPTVRAEALDAVQRPGARLARPARSGAIVLLTSGTTGTPKDVPRAMTLPVLAGPWLASITRMGPPAGAPWLVATPLYHALGMFFVAVAVSTGAPLVLHRRFDAAEVLAAVERHRVATLVVVPAMLQRLLAEPDAHDLSSLRAVLSGAAPLRPDLAAAFMARFGEILFNGYGSSEAGLVTLATPAELLAAPGTVGRPVKGTSVRIIDELAWPAPVGTSGRIVVSSATNFDGSRRLETGDIGHVDRAGRLFVDGRDDDMVISGGENVYPQQVENALAEHLAVADVAVLGVPDDEFGERLAAFVVRRDAASGTDDLRAYLKAALPRYMVPRDIVVLDEIPRSPTGKVARRALRAAVDGAD